MPASPPSAHAAFRAHIEEAAPAALARGKSRVVLLEIDGRRVWLKRAHPDKTRPLHHLQRMLAALLPITLLRYTGDVAGQPALEREVKIIERLHRRGVRVPEVLACGNGWIALGDLGPSVEQTLRQTPERARARELAGAGAWALIRLHRVGGWHGTPQTRNLVGGPEDIGFIDFEEDVGDRMDARSAQTRDWILFLCSLYRTELRFPGLLSELVREIQPELPIHARRALLRFRLLCTPLALALKPVSRWLGRDVRQCIALWEACGEINPQLRRRLRIMFRIGATLGTLLWFLGRRAG